MNFLVTLRYLIFAIFISASAVVSSIAVWNSSLVSPFSRESRIDVYFVVVGALGLGLTFTIIFIELVRRNAFTSRVWFEVVWTSTFFLLELGGASVLTAFGPDDMCQGHANGKTGSCSSTRVLVGFVWLCTFILLIYLAVLVVLILLNRNSNETPRIWQRAIHNFPPLTSTRSNAPAPPFLPRFSRDKMTAVVSPVPQRPNTVPSALYSMRSVGLGSQYQIEHFRPPANAPGPPIPSSPVISPADYLHRSPSTAGTVQAAVALYPQFLSSAYVTQPTPARTQPSQPASRSPPPLGDWPRTDAPLRVKRKLPPTTGPEAIPSRPMGPRTRSGRTNMRPPPLDLSTVSSTRRDRDPGHV
ncbi:hypothetical protein DFH06DRAFT_970182 [Mycena polygramma]|nr:hypothetical protein DFH06DRAFT_970182 [Mycena polygramma]